MYTALILTQQNKSCLEIEKLLPEGSGKLLANHLSITKQNDFGLLESEKISVLLNRYAGVLYRGEHQNLSEDLLLEVARLAQGQTYLVVDHGCDLYYLEALLSKLDNAVLFYI